MKKLFYILVLITGIANAQIVNFPDANFKAKLLQADVTNTIATGANGINIKIDINNNGEIELSEANLLSRLNVFNSNISDLTGIQSFINLKGLRCSNNLLVNLDVSGMTALEDLTSNDNFLTNLNITNATSLNTIDCRNNQLTSMNLTNISNILYYLDCSNNLITSFITPNPITVYEILCTNNQISHLDLTNLKLDTDLSVFTGNPLITINAKNNFTENNYFIPNLNGISTLEYICVDENEVSLITNQLTNFSFSNVVVNTYCTFTPGGNYNTINGLVQFDADNNGCDVNDGGQPNVRVNINDGTNQGATFTNVNGGYSFYTQAGSFAISPAIENPAWFNFSPTTATIPFANNNNNTATQNFCLTANGVHPDLEIVIVPITPARPGFEAVYKIVYRNKGNQTLSQQYGVNFFYNQNLMVYTSSTVTPSSIGVGSTSWDYANLQPFESREIIVTLTINAPTDTNPVNIGDVLTFTSSILPQAGDENTIDNLFILNQTVVGSFDPNDITCLEGDMVSPTEIGNYLHYNVRFENTGTAAAENVVVKVDVNPADFDINSLQLMNTSNPVDARINVNKVEFIFQNIMLESGGHGNVLLKMRTKANLQQGDLVNKRANIYFDYNFPIETNDAETVFQSLSNPSFEQETTVKIYPNPTSSIVTIKSNFNIKTIELYDVQGRLLQTDLINTSETTLDITSKSKGMYFLKVVSEKGIKVEKLMKE